MDPHAPVCQDAHCYGQPVCGV